MDAKGVLMAAEREELLLKDEVFTVVGAAMDVLNELGHGLLEKPYENALLVELGLLDVPVSQQERFEVSYKGVRVGEYIPDLIAYNKLVVDTKVIERIGDVEIGQMLNYLKICRMRVGLILNFKHPKLEWKRVVL
jgi:GxxExxY protein